MKKPWYQQAIEIFNKSGGYLLAFVVLVDKGFKALNFVTISFATVVTIGLVAVYLLLYGLVRAKLVKWVAKDGNLHGIVGPGKNQVLSFGIALVLLWGMSLLNYFSTEKESDADRKSALKVVKPIFDSADNRFKILILPFEKLCSYEGLNYDVGNVLTRRLNALGNKDTINLIANYLGDTIIPKNFSATVADSVRRYHHADVILYGFYSFSKCEGGNKDKICFNYRLDPVRWQAMENKNKDDSMVSISGLSALLKGEGQEEVDNILYKMAGFSDMLDLKPASAIKWFKKITRFEEDGQIEKCLGSCYMQLNQFDSCISHYEKLLRMQPANLEACNNIGAAYLRWGKFSKARSVLENGLRIFPQNTGLLFNLGMSFDMMHDSAGAMLNFLKVLAIEPYDHEVMYVLGRHYLQFRDTATGVEYFNKYLSKSPWEKRGWIELGKVHLAQSDFSSARNCFMKAYRFHPKDSVISELLGFTCLRLKDYETAIRYFRDALKFRGKSPTNAETYGELGTAYNLLNDTANARKCFEESLSIAPAHYQSLSSFADFFYKQRDFGKAVKYYSKALAVMPSSYNCLLNLGSAYSNLSKYKEAKDCYVKLNRVNPRDTAVIFFTGQLFLFLKDTSRAIQYYESGLKLNPYHEAVLSNMGMYYSIFFENKSHGNPVKNRNLAISYYNRVLKINPKSNMAVGGLADLYFVSKDYTNAERYFMELTKLGPCSAEAIFDFAIIRNLSKDSSAALQLLRVAIASDKQYKSKAVKENRFSSLRFNKDFIALTK